MLSRFLQLLLCMLAPMFLQAQVSIKGVVLNKDRQALPQAIVIVQSLPDSTVLKTEVADSAGTFNLQIATNGSFLLKAATAGFVNGYRILQGGENEYETELVLQVSAQNLKGVVVTAQKPLIERKVDRTIFNVERSVSAIGSDAFELLKKAPGVRVNNTTISMSGKSTVNVMVNDRLIPMGGDELEAMLRSMAADNIARIEVITTPPARYDAAGNAGIINIVTKKQNRNGFNGNLTGTYMQRVKASERLDGAFNWRQGKVNIYGNTSQNDLNLTSPQKTETFYPGQKQVQNLQQNNRPYYSRSQLGIDYNIGKRAVLGVLYTAGFTYRDMDQFYSVANVSLPAAITDSVTHTYAYTFETAFRNVFNVNYELQLDTNGKKLNVDVDVFTRWNDNRRYFNTRSSLPNGTETPTKLFNRSTGMQMLNYQTVKGDVYLPCRETVFTFGGKASFINNNSDNVFKYLSSNRFIVDYNKTNKFDYSENTQALYASAAQSWDKWEAQIGLRAEYTQTKSVSQTTTQSNTNGYFKLFPTVYVQYHPNDGHVFNFNYSKRINRPDFWDMNPFRQYTTNVSYEAGNPFLQPSFSNNIEAAYTLKDKYTFTFYANFEEQIVSRVSRVDSSNNSFNFTMANAGKSAYYGLSTFGTTDIVKWWQLNWELFGYFNRFESSFYNSSFTNAATAASLNVTNTFTLNKSKTLFAEIAIYYVTNEQANFDVQRSYYNIATGFKALLFDKRLVVGVNANDMFKNELWRQENLFNKTFQEHYYDVQSIYLSLTWKFGNRYIKDRRQRSVNSEESSRAN